MKFQTLVAGVIAGAAIIAASSPASPDDKLSDGRSPDCALAAQGLHSLVPSFLLAFDDPPPSERGAKEEKPPRGPDGEPGGPDFGPGGPGGPRRGPGELGGPGGRGRGPGGPGGDKGPPPPRDDDGRGPPRPGPGGRRGPDGGRFEGPMRRPDPEMVELLKKEDDLDNQANELATQYQRAASPDKEKLQKQIEETVNKQFDVRQQRRKLQLDHMQKDLDELKSIYEKKNSSRDTLIKGRVLQLLSGGGTGF
jgi:hypothetical protein